MNRAEFIGELTDKLAGLPIEERSAAVRYYEEYFEEAGPEREGEIVAELGSPTAVAASIMQDYSSVPIVTDRVAYNRQAAADWQQPAGGETAQSAHADGARTGASSWERLRNWAESKMPLWVWIVLLVLLLPTIVGLLGGAMGLVGGLVGLVTAVLGVVLAVVVVGFVACLAVGLMGVAFVLGGIALVVAGVAMLIPTPAVGMLSIGVGVVMASVGLLVTMLGVWIASKLLPRVIGSLANALNSVTSCIGGWIRKDGKAQ